MGTPMLRVGWFLSFPSPAQTAEGKAAKRCPTLPANPSMGQGAQQLPCHYPANHFQMWHSDPTCGLCLPFCG